MEKSNIVNDIWEACTPGHALWLIRENDRKCNCVWRNSFVKKEKKDE
jgi:hypothetical protein